MTSGRIFSLLAPSQDEAKKAAEDAAKAEEEAKKAKAAAAKREALRASRAEEAAKAAATELELDEEDAALVAEVLAGGWDILLLISPYSSSPLFL